jgi:IS5 family transposase
VPVEFGYKAQVVDNSDGSVLDYLVMQGNQADAPLLRPAVERIKARFAKLPKAVTANPGSGEVITEQEPSALGVTRS